MGAVFAYHLRENQDGWNLKFIAGSKMLGYRLPIVPVTLLVTQYHQTMGMPQKSAICIQPALVAVIYYSVAEFDEAFDHLSPLPLAFDDDYNRIGSGTIREIGYYP
ncbi:hypothetical protein MASR2M48_14570 [Spirochaetota bacterium]